jgi:hypothetical protein
MILQPAKALFQIRRPRPENERASGQVLKRSSKWQVLFEWPATKRRMDEDFSALNFLRGSALGRIRAESAAALAHVSQTYDRCGRE